MTDDFALKEWLMLSLTDGVGPAAMRNLLRAFGSPGAARRAVADELRTCVPAAVATNIKRGEHEKTAEHSCAWAARDGCRIMTLADTDYPPLLLDMVDAPPLLYVFGNSRVLTNRPLVAIVGSRNASPAGVNNTEIFATALSKAGVGVVSGMAQGVDCAAHRGAMQGDAGTVGVMGTGVDIIYPKQNRTMARAIAEHGGALVSDFPLGTPPLAGNFPRRNRIISGLARACLVVEAALKSGSLITAEYAVEQGREVFAVPGSINSPMHRGCHKLIKQGAKLAENVGDVLEELNLRRPPSPLPPPPEEGDLLNFIDFEPTTVDDIAERSGMSAESLMSELLILEMDGKIVSAVGGSYQRV